MKRLTEYTIPETGFTVVPEEKYKRILMDEKPSVEKVYNRLKKIEDILGDEYDLDELKEVVQAKREGRCVVLPFKPPKWVYMCNKRFPEPAQAYYASAVNVLSEMEKGCVFGDTPEEAEAALKARED